MTNSFPRKFNYDPITNSAIECTTNATFRTEGSQIKVACRGRGRKKRRRLGKPARFVGKIKKGEEEIRRQAALTFSGG